MVKKWLNRLKKIGPGLIAGAADDDPSGIATCIQSGAQFGYGQLWTALYFTPLLIAVQEASARIGAVTGKGITELVRNHYSRYAAYAIATVIVVANIANIGADLGAMASAAALIVPVNRYLLALIFSLSILLVVFTSYRSYSRILKWLSLAFFAYVITVFFVPQPWEAIARMTVTPRVELTFGFLYVITGVIGTTVSPYMFFWEANQEVEEVREKHLLRKKKKSRITGTYVKQIQADNAVGMILSNITGWSVILTAATVLHGHGLTSIGSAADAAKALEPLVRSFPGAGFLSKLIFSIGIIGLGLLTIPVLSGSASYAVAGALNWKASLNYKVRRARGFYIVMIVSTAVGMFLNLLGLNPISTLVAASVINGLVAAPLLIFVALIAQNKKIMGGYRSGRLSRLFLWLTCAALTISSVALIYSFAIRR